MANQTCLWLKEIVKIKELATNHARHKSRIILERVQTDKLDTDDRLLLGSQKNKISPNPARKIGDRERGQVRAICRHTYSESKVSKMYIKPRVGGYSKRIGILVFIKYKFTDHG